MGNIYRLDNLGHASRACVDGDNITKELLDWYDLPECYYPDEIQDSDVFRAHVSKFIEKGLTSEKVSGLKEIQDFQASKKRNVLIRMFLDLFDSVRYALWDIVSWRKVKTSTVLLSSTVLGAGLGALLGSFVIPLLGTAIGGVVGASLASALASIGGWIGLSILGGFFGQNIGKKVARKYFKYEENYQPSKKFTQVLHKKFHLEYPVIDMINGYLYNRVENIQNQTLKKCCEETRIAWIYQADDLAMARIGYLFIQELVLLTIDGQKKSNPNVQQDIHALRHILKALMNASVSKELKLAIITILQEPNLNTYAQKNYPLYYQAQAGLKVPSFFESASREFATTRCPSKPVKDTELPLEGEFIKSLASEGRYSIRQNDASQVDNSAQIYQICLPQNNGTLSFEIRCKERADSVVTEISTAFDKNRDTREIIEQLVKQSLLYSKQTGEKQVTIMANGDDELAIKMYGALSQVGLSPQLDLTKYPEGTLERAAIYAKTNKLSNFQ